MPRLRLLSEKDLTEIGIALGDRRLLQSTLAAQPNRAVVAPRQPGKESKQEFDVFVKTLTGKTIRVRVQPSLTIEALKTAIHVKEGGVVASKRWLSMSGVAGIPLDQQKLIYQGKFVEDDNRTIASYSIISESTLHLVLKYAGPCSQPCLISCGAV